jgi:PEP-CTERM motif
VKRTLGKIALLAAIALLTSTAVYADTVTLASLGTAADAGQTNSSGNPTIAIDPNAAWSSALGTSSWVSFTTSGNTSASNYAQVANGTVTSFFDTFSLSGTPTSGSIEVMADDSTSVWLNGNLLVAEASTTNNTYSTCSDFAISCRGAYVINLPTDYLVTGNNVLQFDVAQRAGMSYGLDYYGTINTTAAVPEPSSILLLGSGISAAFMRLRKKTK